MPSTVLHKASTSFQYTESKESWRNTSNAKKMCANLLITSYVTHLTYRPVTWTPETTTSTTPSIDDFSDLDISQPLPVIIHATDGKGKRAKTAKIKLSTVVQPDELEAFFARYADVCKSGMTGALKKRDRKGRKAKKKKGGAAGTGEKA
jgi:hypothetical protein